MHTDLQSHLQCFIHTHSLSHSHTHTHTFISKNLLIRQKFRVNNSVCREGSKVSISPACSQFHRNFTSSFCTDILAPKNCKAKLYQEKSCTKHFHMKTANVKCWWNWHLISPSPCYDQNFSLLTVWLCNFFVKRISAKKLFVKCWCNWIKERRWWSWIFSKTVSEKSLF